MSNQTKFLGVHDFARVESQFVFQIISNQQKSIPNLGPVAAEVALLLDQMEQLAQRVGRSSHLMEEFFRMVNLVSYLVIT